MRAAAATGQAERAEPRVEDLAALRGLPQPSPCWAGLGRACGGRAAAYARQAQPGGEGRPGGTRLPLPRGRGTDCARGRCRRWLLCAGDLRSGRGPRGRSPGVFPGRLALPGCGPAAPARLLRRLPPAGPGPAGPGHLTWRSGPGLAAFGGRSRPMSVRDPAAGSLPGVVLLLRPLPHRLPCPALATFRSSYVCLFSPFETPVPCCPIPTRETITNLDPALLALDLTCSGRLLPSFKLSITNNFCVQLLCKVPTVGSAGENVVISSAVGFSGLVVLPDPILG